MGPLPGSRSVHAIWAGKTSRNGKSRPGSIYSRIVKEEKTHAEGGGQLLADGLCLTLLVQGGWAVRQDSSAEQDS